ncbi:MAG: AMP-binding protein [Candidatus Marinimicrobia bacterium]|nr:AMP-binding protein [Candidatus Neomarinimicrobiota bacterium]
MYSDLGNNVKSIGLVLDSLGIKQGDRVAIMSDNREEWIMADLANVSIGLVSVPIYPTLSPKQVLELLSHSNPRVLFISTPELLQKIVDSGYEFERIIIFDKHQAPKVKWIQDIIKEGEKILLKEPNKFDELMETVKGDDLACINYTSGTTGVPKGVMISHENFVRDVDNSIKIIQIFAEDVFLSFLPLSHVLERMGGYYVPMILGATIGFAESTETVVQNMGEVQPTILISVPRLFEKIYGTVMSGVLSGSAIKKSIFYWALKAGKARMENEISGTPISSCRVMEIPSSNRLPLLLPTISI